MLVAFATKGEGEETPTRTLPLLKGEGKDVDRLRVEVDSRPGFAKASPRQVQVLMLK
jgi:hypothetical protein